MNQPVHISSLLVSVLPDHIDQLIMQIEAQEGASIEHRTDEGQLVISLETETQAQINEVLDLLNAQNGVMSASLVYHHFEEAPDEEVTPSNCAQSDNGKLEGVA